MSSAAVLGECQVPLSPEGPPEAWKEVAKPQPSHGTRPQPLRTQEEQGLPETCSQQPQAGTGHTCALDEVGAALHYSCIFHLTGSTAPSLPV